MVAGTPEGGEAVLTSVWKDELLDAPLEYSAPIEVRKHLITVGGGNHLCLLSRNQLLDTCGGLACDLLLPLHCISPHRRAADGGGKNWIWVITPLIQSKYLWWLGFAYVYS